MPILDLDALLAPVSDDAPGGPDLEHDAAFIALRLLSLPTPERTVRVLDAASGREVDRAIAGKDADHRAVLPAALALLARSKDLRVAMLLLPAATRADGLAGYAAVTRLLLALCQRQWATVHPQLDPDDELDPTMRINILAGYADQQLGLQALRCAPLAEARSVGRFCVRDLEVAAGELNAFDGQAAATHAMLLAACQGGAAEELAARQRDGAAALADLEALEALFHEQAGRGPDFGVPKQLLRRLLALYREAAGAADGGPAAEAEPGAAPLAAQDGAIARAGAAPGSRGDARRLLAQACDWLERAEPAHPAPLLVRRAIRLLDMNFIDIMRELTPEAVTEIERLGGIRHE